MLLSRQQTQIILVGSYKAYISRHFPAMGQSSQPKHIHMGGMPHLQISHFYAKIFEPYGTFIDPICKIMGSPPTADFAKGGAAYGGEIYSGVSKYRYNCRLRY